MVIVCAADGDTVISVNVNVDGVTVTLWHSAEFCANSVPTRSSNAK
jgi:hypothetical protein